MHIFSNMVSACELKWVSADKKIFIPGGLKRNNHEWWLSKKYYSPITCCRLIRLFCLHSWIVYWHNRCVSESNAHAGWVEIKVWKQSWRFDSDTALRAGMNYRHLQNKDECFQSSKRKVKPLSCINYRTLFANDSCIWIPQSVHGFENPQTCHLADMQ